MSIETVSPSESLEQGVDFKRNTSNEISETILGDGLSETPSSGTDVSSEVKGDSPIGDSVENKEITRHLPNTNGAWEAGRGESMWLPDRDYVPMKSNPEGKQWGTILDSYEIKGISFRESEPVFTDISKGTVEISDFSDERYGIGGNFDQADEKLAQERNCSKEEVREWRQVNGYTWHEGGDCRTMDKVPSIVHGNIPHSGGISVFKNGII